MEADRLKQYSKMSERERAAVAYAQRGHYEGIHEGRAHDEARFPTAAFILDAVAKGFEENLIV